MNKYKLFITIVLLVLISSCVEKNKTYFDIKISNIDKKLTPNDTLKIDFSSAKYPSIDKIEFRMQDLKMNFNQTSIQVPLAGLKLGEWDFEVEIYADDYTERKKFNLKIVNYEKPKIYTYQIVNEYPHDIEAYTQGLEFYADTLYESTGQYGKSSLRKVDLETGKVLDQINLANQYFGEGLTILNEQIFQLTWREGVGFIYDLNDFSKTGEFEYQTGKEGWGLCNDGDRIYKSDGSEKIWILNPKNQSIINYLQPTTHKGKSSRLNELEWVDGKIYANTYQKEGVAIINPNNGAVEGIIDLRGLKDQVKQHKKLDVLNGIAYHPESKRLFVTGKNWNKLFEIKIIEK